MTEKRQKNHVLVGNAFPLSLVRNTRLLVESKSVDDLREMLVGAEVVSFWGHENTRLAAEAVLGVSLAPKMPRPAITLSAEARPQLEGYTFDTCWVLSPDYRKDFRPAIGQEVPLDAIRGWHVLKLTWQ